MDKRLGTEVGIQRLWFGTYVIARTRMATG